MDVAGPSAPWLRKQVLPEDVAGVEIPLHSRLLLGITNQYPMEPTQVVRVSTLAHRVSKDGCSDPKLQSVQTVYGHVDPGPGRRLRLLRIRIIVA